jgi:DNA-binding NarL/FixJ family response regulator
MRRLTSPNGAAHAHETTVLVAVGSAQVREALVAVLGTLDGFRVVAEADTDEAAVDAARSACPCLALVEAELSGCGGWWAMQRIRDERLAKVVVGLGRRADDAHARVAGVHGYVQMGASPRDLLSAVEAAMASLAAQAEHDLLPDAHAILDEPALIDL